MPSGARAPRTFYPTSLLRIQQKSSGPLTRSGSRAPRTSLRFLPCVCAGQRAGSSKRSNDKTHLFNTEIVATCTRENCNLSPDKIASELKLNGLSKSLRKAINFYAYAKLGARKSQCAADRRALVRSVLLKEVPLLDVCALIEERGAYGYTVHLVLALQKWYM